jgi:hypothetical protein
VENISYQDQIDEAALLQQLSTVPELRLVDDDAIRRAKEKLAGKHDGESFVKTLNLTACDRAEEAGLSIEWKLMDKRDRDDMVVLTSELRKNQLVGTDRKGSSFFVSSDEDIASELNKSLDVRSRQDLLPTMVQVLQIEPEPTRLVLVNKLELMGYNRPQQRTEIVKAIAARALFDNSAVVRDAALRALEVIDKGRYEDVLMKGLDYPWPPVVWRASYALRKLGTLQSVPKLAKMLEKRPKQGGADTVTELVKISHLHSCLFCHRPAFDESGAKVPIPGESLTTKESSRSSAAPDLYAPAKPRELAVDPGATCLHQDFSVILPVPNCGSWPSEQRFDFATRVRPATRADDRRLDEMHRERQKAAHYALEGIVAREGKVFEP